MKTKAFAIAAILAPLAAGASAQTQAQTQALENPAIQAGEILSLSDWRLDEVYADGASVDAIFDTLSIRGAGGEDIGDVENIVFHRDGRVLSLIAEVGGFWDIGDTHVNIPWDQVRLEGNSLVVPVTEESVDDYSAFRTNYLLAGDASDAVQVVDDDLATGPQAFRATDLIGDYARIGEGSGYANIGYVEDLVISGGRLAAVVVRPDAEGYGMRGRFAYPYYNTGWRSGYPYYDMPYDREQAMDAQRFDYDRVGSNQ